MSSYPERGRHQPTEVEVLRAMLAIDGDALVSAIGAHLDAWHRQDEIAAMLGDLAASGLVVKGHVAGWRLSDRGERRAATVVAPR